jgi:chemotaxis protein methyltransferase CheR
MLSTQQFERMRRLALGLAGIELVERHRDLLDRRLHRLGILDSGELDLLLIAAEQGEAKATQQLLGLVTTKHTSFFRHPRHFDIAAECALKAVHDRGRARLWSAAAATGEEPYSLAMALIETFRSDDPPVDILATDVDMEALATAERGQFGEPAVRPLEPFRRERFFQELGIRRWGIVPAVRRLVKFQKLNLAGMGWPIAGPFDVIFCRNALMYLENRRRCAVLERMASLLAADGLLTLDPAEHLGKAAHMFRPEVHGVWRLRSSSLAESRPCATATL